MDRGRGEPRQLCMAPRHPGPWGLRVSPHSWGWGWPLDAFPGLPLPRHKASFLLLVPWLPRGAWGAGLGVEGGLMGRDIPMLSTTMLGWGHKGKSWQLRTADSSS